MRLLSLVLVLAMALPAAAALQLRAIAAERAALARQLQGRAPAARIEVVAVLPLRDLGYRCGWATQAGRDLTFVRPVGATNVPRLYDGDEAVDIPPLASPEHWRARLDDMALQACRRRLAGRRLSQAIGDGVRSPEAPFARLLLDGRYLEIPAGNVEGKVHRSPGFTPVDAVALRGRSPTWEPRPWHETAPPGFGDRVWGLIATPPVGAATAFARRREALERDLETLSSERTGSGDEHRHVRAVRGSLNGSSEGDLYVSGRDRRVTVCNRQPDPARHPHCRTIAEHRGLLIELRFGAHYAARREEILETLLARLDEWSRS